MVTISESNKPKFRHHTSSQLRYTITYVVVTVLVLAFLNLYCSQANEQLFKQSKYTSLLEKAQLTADEIAARGDVNIRNSSAVILRMSSRPSRVIVTDENSQVIYDSQYIILDKVSLPVEIADALDGDNAFSWEYRDGVITAAVAVPIYTIRGLSGCLYMMEVDTNDGALLKSLHTSILTITIVLGVFLVLFSIFYLHRYSRRLNKIMASMRIIQEGNYTHKIDMRGNDELSFLAEEFNYLTDRLQISENKRRQFVSDASHELKTPLASIKLLSDSILQYDMDMETVREFAGDIGNEADRLNRMTAKLLALTKDESNTANDEAEIIYMSPTVERVVKMLSGIAAQTRIKITMDLEEDTPILIQEDDLYQITFNLVENGIKYNIPGGSLSISLHRQEEMMVLRVEDTGMGIPEESMSHIFERFYRVDKARSRASGGSGLGLAIVKNMVERNNGEIHLESAVGKGTTFMVAFPCFDITDNLDNFYDEQLSEENQ